MLVEFIKVNEDAILPKKNFETDSGFDLFSIEKLTIPAKGSITTNVGLEVGYISRNYWFRIEGRSGLGFKKGIVPHAGIIDNSYRGLVGIKLFNFSNESVTIEKGQGIAQMIIYKLIDCEVSFAKNHSKGERDRNGFGSSDI